VQGCKGKMRSFASVVRCGGLEDLQKISNLTNSITVKARCNDLNGEGVFNRYNEVIVTTDVGLSNHVPPLY
jgi:hypothetical protein